MIREALGDVYLTELKEKLEKGAILMQKSALFAPC